MELKLEDLAPYLPYGLKAVCSQDIDGVLYKHINLTKRFYSMPTAILTNFKPILRPLADLKTSHNIFKDKSICFIDESDNGGSFTIDDIYFKYQESSFSDWRNAYLLLLENHFDVFGLIEKGLAIDINKALN
jgi:hypothetical protein